VLLTEDKDFGLLAYAGGVGTAGVMLVRYPVNVRAGLGDAVIKAVADFGEHLTGGFVVLEPGRARLSRPPER
jgi:hypothetical protein